MLLMKKMFICILEPQTSSIQKRLSFVMWLGSLECDCAANG
jgi:hypothetical protein